MTEPPWHGTAYPVPQRVGGNRVLAAIKLPTTPAETAHQWIAITEPTGGGYLVLRVYYSSSDGYRGQLPGRSFDDYVKALTHMVTLVGKRLV